MGDEVLSPPAAPTSEPFSQRFGVVPHLTLRIPISTSISESGIGGSGGASLVIAENFNERYGFMIDVPYAVTKLKNAPTTTADGTSAQHSHWALMFGWGRISRSLVHFNDSGRYTAGLNVGVTPMLGRGSSTVTQSDRSFEGSTFSFGKRASSTFDIGTSYTVTGEFKAGERFPVFAIGPGVYYGLQYEGKNSELNRVRVDLMLHASVGYGDASTKAGSEADPELGPLGIGWGLYSMGHNFWQRYLFDKTIGSPMESLSNYGLLGGDVGNTRNSMYDVPFLQAGAAFLNGASSPLTPPLRSGQTWFWGFTALRAVGGIAFLGAGTSTEGKAGGVADLMGATRLASFAIAGIEEPNKRLSLAPETVEHREMIVNLTAYALGSAGVLFGAVTGNDTMLKGGNNANVGVALTPDPLERGMTERTDIGYIPVSFLFSNGRTGHRGGILVHKSWHDFPSRDVQFFSSAIFISPMLTPGNASNMATSSGPFQDVALNTDIGAALGLEWKTTWTRASLGMETRGIFGSQNAQAGIGGTAGFDLLFPFSGKEDGSGMGVGVRGSAMTLSPKGSQYEIAPWLGASLRL